jgi:NitT/TauT family transport system permease protein
VRLTSTRRGQDDDAEVVLEAALQPHPRCEWRKLCNSAQTLPLIVIHTRRGLEALRGPTSLVADAFFLLLVASVIGAMVLMGREVAAPQRAAVVIDLSFRALPSYMVLTLSRGFLAYGLSLAFTLLCGTVAAHSRPVERVVIPAMDVLQAIPVLGFLPGLVLALVALLPRRELGLEVAAILMMFTGQVWNMAFSFHGSLRSIPQEFRDVAAVHHLGRWQAFRLLELPSAMTGLVWNSMMSMAGGWFFITVNEAFTLGGRDYRLPGLGSYMHEAIMRGAVGPMVAAATAMVLMIIGVDQLFWWPIVVWSRRFNTGQDVEADRARSWVLRLMERSFLVTRLGRALHRPRLPSLCHAAVPPPSASRAQSSPLHRLTPVVRGAVLATITLAAAWAAWSLLRLVRALPLRDAATHDDWVTVIFALGASSLRTTAAVAIAALWALPAGILIGRSRRWSQRFQPVVQVLASFPAPMLFPLVTLLVLALRVPFTVGCVTLMLLAAQWYVLFNVIAGASAMPAELAEVAAVYRISRWQRWTRLYVPAVFPYLVTGLLTAAGTAWNVTIVAEYMELRGRTLIAFGLGSVISRATAQGRFPLLATAVVVMAVWVVLINRLFWKPLYRLAEERYSLNA